MTLDIIIPVLNEAENLKNLLPYLLSTLKNSISNVIVVDSVKSTDETEQICGQYKVQYLQSEVTQRAVQLNLGAKHSKGEALMFLHADVLPPENFHELIKASFKNHDFGMFAYRFDRVGIFFPINAYFTKYDGYFSGGGDQCFFIKRTVFEALKGFDENYLVMEDFDFFRRIKAAKFEYEVVAKRATVSARKYDKNGYFKINWFNLKMLRAFKKGESPDALNTRYKKYQKSIIV